MPDRALSFFDLLWPGGLPPAGHLVIAYKSAATGMDFEFFDDLGAAAKQSLILGRSYDTYVGMAAQPRLPSGRGTTASALAIPGLWLDLDFDKGFRDVAGVLRFVAALPLPPSLLVGSGGGVHAHWLFKEYLEAGEDKTAASLELGWWAYCNELARIEVKAKLDSVGDLARVLRIPGTLNHKRKPTLEVSILEDSGKRYNPSDFEQWKSEARTNRAAVAMVGFDFHLSENAQPPFDKWHVAVTNQPEIEQTYQHRLKMPVDTSLSGYDLSLATRLDIIGWSPQEIVDTVIAHRRKYQHEITDVARLKDPLHVKDRGYFERLLRKARESTVAARVSAEVTEMAEAVADEISVHGKPSAMGRKNWFTAMSGLLGIEVIDIWAVDTFEGSWTVRLMYDGKAKDIPVPKAKLRDWTFWVDLVTSAQVSTENLPSKAPAAFRTLISRVGTVVRITGQRQMMTTRGLFLRYLAEAAGSAHPYEEADVLGGQTFLRVETGELGLADWNGPEECVFIRTATLYGDVKTGRCPPLTDAAKELAAVGFRARTVAVERYTGKLTSRYYWCYPVSRLLQELTELAVDANEAAALGTGGELVQ